MRLTNKEVIVVCAASLLGVVGACAMLLAMFGCALGDLHVHVYATHTHEVPISTDSYRFGNEAPDELENDPRWEALDDVETID